jgi:hypothetical protein
VRQIRTHVRSERPLIVRCSESLGVGQTWSCPVLGPCCHRLLTHPQARRAQVQLQVSNTRPSSKHAFTTLLFARAAHTAEVRGLIQIATLKHWSVSQDLDDRLAKLGAPDGRRGVTAIESTIRLEETKVRFDSKVRAAVKLGIIDQPLDDELIEFYTARNMIHIHAELRKGADCCGTPSRGRGQLGAPGGGAAARRSRDSLCPPRVVAGRGGGQLRSAAHASRALRVPAGPANAGP